MLHDDTLVLWSTSNFECQWRVQLSEPNLVHLATSASSFIMPEMLDDREILDLPAMHRRFAVSRDGMYLAASSIRYVMAKSIHADTKPLYPILGRRVSMSGMFRTNSSSNNSASLRLIANSIARNMKAYGDMAPSFVASPLSGPQSCWPSYRWKDNSSSSTHRRVNLYSKCRYM